jgi:DNA-binding CsgD family transcriptional regulator
MGTQYESKSTRLVRPPPTPRQEKLTPRQLEVLALLCEGLPNKLIARRLDMAGGTVKVHVVRILRALNVSSRLQAVVAARSLGLLDATDSAQATLQETVTAMKMGAAATPYLRRADDVPSRVRALESGRATAVAAA